MTYDEIRKLQRIVGAFETIAYEEYPQYRISLLRIWQPENKRFLINLNISDRYGFKNTPIASNSYTEEAFIQEVGELTGFKITKWLLNKVDDLLNSPKKLDL